MTDDPDTAPDPRTPWVPVTVLACAAVLGRFGGPAGRWVGSVGTAAHEIGHAALADLLTGRVVSITVFRRGGGVTLSEASGSDWRTFLVSAAGYPATLIAALALLTGVLFAQSSRRMALGGAAVAWTALLLWTPFSARVPDIDDRDQRLTWLLLLGVGALLIATLWLSDGWRRVALGVLSVGLLTDAFRAGSDLVSIESGPFDVATDADSMADAAVFGAGFWAWAMRLGLVALAAAWAWWALRRWTTDLDRRLPP